MATTKDTVIANQIFLGLPWKTVRKKYETITDSFKKKYPLSFVIVGRGDNQDAEDLLNVIYDKIESSSYAIFDATGGNANVSLEYGFTEALDIPRALYLSVHKASKKTTDSAIISDLAGKKHNQYTNADSLEALLDALSKKHPYTIKFERFLKQKYKNASKGDKKRYRALALKVIHELDNQTQVRRVDIVQNLQADAASYTSDEVDTMIKALHKEKLVQSQQGPHSRVHVAYE